MTRRHITITILTLAGLVAILLLSPLLLLLVRAIYSVDWQVLSLIGQSYTGVAALLSLLTLAGVVWSIVLQTRQSEATRLQSAIEMHLGLWSKAMDDSRLAEVFTKSNGKSHEQFSRDAFMMLVFRYMHYSYATGLLEEQSLRVQLRDDFFSHEAFRERWSRASPSWKSEEAPSEREFIRIADEECERATKAALHPVDTEAQHETRQSPD